ncbi:Rab family GTPase [Ascoidea rubescens DSM 1968]|uniref:Ras-domain-containing protein n=1 Tax=Ascoidea rubescens DSM 1968 TaxID=1344418 RepID=A0A1D2VNY8_9ASCO|nr:ras-domain-containing protein [Ascoidea rubescens DSM 1968]ODV63318.1 ras-domain-containing protein [Ascoidea rubescens DSM 1968]
MSNLNQRTSTSSSNNTSIPTIKVLLIGDPAVGKTSIRAQFVHHVFSNAYRATVGGDYLTTKIKLNEIPNLNNNNNNNNNSISNNNNDTNNNSNSIENDEAILQIWDTAGQERFNSIGRTFYRGTDVAILVYDISNPNSFYNLSKWANDFLENVHVSKPSIIIVGNKLDKPINDHLISLRQCKDFVLNNNDSFIDEYLNNLNDDIFQISAKDFNQVQSIFKRVTYLGLKSLEQNHQVFNFDNIDISSQLSSNNSKLFPCC